MDIKRYRHGLLSYAMDMSLHHVMRIATQILAIGAFAMLYSCKDFRETKVLYFAHALPREHPVHLGVLEMQSLLSEKSGGSLELEVFPDGQLGSEREVLELLQIGSIAMTKVSAAAMSNFAPQYKVTGIPYLFRDRDHLFSVLEGDIGRQILASGSEYLLRGLCFYDAGARSFYMKKQPIKSTADLDGMKIRTMNDQMSVDMVNSLGGSATPMSFGELYTALQQNVVDGAENNIPSFVTSNHYEVCKYYSFDQHTMVPDVIIVGTKFWESLSPQEQVWLQEAADESVVKQKMYWSQTVKENMEILKEANVQFFYPDKSEFALKSKSVLDNMLEDAEIRKLIMNIQAL